MTDINAFITNRVDDQIAYFSRAAEREQGRGKDWQNALIVAAAATPMLIGLAELIHGDWQIVMRALSLISAAVAAVATSIVSTRKYWENGVMYRAREQALIREKSLFDMRAADYAEGAAEVSAEELFVLNVEQIIADDVGAWTGRMKDASAHAQSKKAAASAAPKA